MQEKYKKTGLVLDACVGINNDSMRRHSLLELSSSSAPLVPIHTPKLTFW